MTDVEMKDLLRPILRTAFDAGCAHERGRGQPGAARGSLAAVFSAGPPAGTATFAGVDPTCFADYFQADERGEYPSDLHRELGLSVRAFSDAAGMRLMCRTGADGAERWSWTARAKSAAVFADWDEKKHKRDRGKFAKTGGGASTAPAPTRAPGNLFDRINDLPGEELSPEVRAGLKRAARAAADWSAGAKGKPPSKAMASARGFRDHARRRRVIRAVRNEGELAAAISGYNLPDSEPADVVHIVGPDGKPMTDPAQVRQALKVRERAVKVLKSGGANEHAKGEAARVLAAPAQFIEVKTLLTAKGDAVHMSAKALGRKEKWIDRYGVSFSVIVIDDRRGRKHSGNRVYVLAGTLGKTVRLDTMQKADGMAGVLELVKGGGA